MRFLGLLSRYVTKNIIPSHFLSFILHLLKGFRIQRFFPKNHTPCQDVWTIGINLAQGAGNLEGTAFSFRVTTTHWHRS